MIYRKGGSGVSEDSAKAVDFFEKGCALESRNSCYMASVVYLIGTLRSPPRPRKSDVFLIEDDTQVATTCLSTRQRPRTLRRKLVGMVIPGGV